MTLTRHLCSRQSSSKSKKYFVKQFVKQSEPQAKSSTDLPPRTPSPGTGSPAPPKTTWRLKTRQEYIESLSNNEILKKGGMIKLQKQQTNRYFKRKKLVDIVMLHGQCNSSEEREGLGLFAHFLMGKFLPARLLNRLRSSIGLTDDIGNHRYPRPGPAKEMDSLSSFHASIYHWTRTPTENWNNGVVQSRV